MRKMGLGPSHSVQRQDGVSLIGAIFIIVVLAFLGLMFLSMISTSSLTAINDMNSTQAFSLAEGGAEFNQRELAVSLDWYRNANDPMANNIRNLGAGSFTAATRVPATKLRRKLLAGDLTAAVYTTGGFPANGFLQIDDDVAAGAEYVQYTVLNATTFTLLAPRGRTIGTVATAPGIFPRGTTVYPVTTLTQAGGLASSCASPSSFTIANQAKFISAGTIDIEGEEISYTGSSSAGGNTTLTGIQRCRGAIGPVAHANGQPVTPLLVGSDTADMQSEVTSTGVVGAATRVVRKTVER